VAEAVEEVKQDERQGDIQQNAHAHIQRRQRRRIFEQAVFETKQGNSMSQNQEACQDKSREEFFQFELYAGGCCKVADQRFGHSVKADVMVLEIILAEPHHRPKSYPNILFRRIKAK
jgi:hypothetical protein